MRTDRQTDGRTGRHDESNCRVSQFCEIALKRGTEKNITDFLFWCRSYGSVYKALHKESGQVLAIKQVPVDTDLQEIIKEISIMQQCDSPWVVKYYGSYFKNTDLWVSQSIDQLIKIERERERENVTVMKFKSSWMLHCYWLSS